MSRNDAQFIDAPLLPGIRQDIDPVRAPIGTLTDAKNVRFGRQGAVSPRRGTKAIRRTTSGAIGGEIGASSAISLLSRTNEAGLVGSSSLLYLRDEARDIFDYAGNYSTARPERLGIGASSFTKDYSVGKSRYGVAINASGYICLIASSPDGASGRYDILIESPTGTLVAEQNSAALGASGGIKTAVLAVGNTFYCFYQFSTGILCREITVSAGSVSVGAAGVTVGTLHNAADHWDVTPAADGVHWYLAHKTGAATVRVDRFAATTSNANTSQTVPGVGPISLFADATDVWLGWFYAATGVVVARTFAPNLSGTRSNATTLATGTTYGPPLFGARPAGGTFYLYKKASTNGGPATSTGYASSPGAASNITSQALADAYPATPISKPDSEGRFWALIGVGSGWTTQRAALIRIQGGGSNPGTNNGYHAVELVTPAYEQPVNAPPVDMFHHVGARASSFAFVLPEVLQNQVGTVGSVDLARLQLYRYTAGLSIVQATARVAAGVLTLGQPHELPGSIAGLDVGAAFASGQLFRAGAPEIGFLAPPAVLSASQNTGGSLVIGGTYSWVFVWEWFDRTGKRHRSAPSEPHTATLTASNTLVTFVVAGLSLTERAMANYEPRLMMYRTQNGGTQYQRETDYDTAHASVEGIEVTLNSFRADSELSDEGFVYTDGGAQPNDIAPSCRFACTSEDRVWFGGLWDATIIQSTKIVVPGEPYQCSDHEAFKVVLPTACTGLAYQDGSLIAFGESAIHIVQGDGPDDTGTQGAWPPPRTIAVGVGCEDYRSILVTAAGVIFKGRRGFCLLPRGLGQPVFIGAAVQRFTQSYPTCLGAALHTDEESRTARFLMTSGSAEIVLVYDLDIAATDPLMGWSYDTYADSLALVAEWPLGTALAKTDLSTESHGFYLDEIDPTYTGDASNTEAITTELSLAPIRPGGLAGWVSCPGIAAVCSGSDGATLNMTAVTDASAASDGSSAGTSTARSWSMPNAPTATLYRYVHPEQPQCSALSLSLQSMRTTGVLGPRFHGFLVESLPLGGLRRALEAER